MEKQMFPFTGQIPRRFRPLRPQTLIQNFSQVNGEFERKEPDSKAKEHGI
jgi:hypothetical protein